jgi:hypothetical protein
MRLEKTPRFAGLAVALALGLALGACATTAPPANNETHVGLVEIVPKDPAGQAFAELLHDAVVRQAAFYGDAGRPITLRIELEKVHYKNPLKALIIGDNNQAKGRVAVLDPETGRESTNFIVEVDAERGGLNGGAIALTVIGAFDPTGLVDLGSSAAYATSASLHHSSTATQMSVNFATETLRQTYGDARAKAVAQEIAANRKAARK